MAIANDIPRSPYVARVLVVEDDPDLRGSLVDTLANLGFEVCAAGSVIEARRVLERNDFDVVLTDVRMPGSTGIELCAYISGDRPGTPTVVMTAFGDASAAIEALRAGAVDFITKPFDMERLSEVLDRVLLVSRANLNMTRIAPAESHEYEFRELVGGSPEMERVRRELVHAIRADSNILISGETGSGKGLLARSLHNASWRKRGKFVILDCRTVPHEIVELELLGYLRGAIAGSEATLPRLFAQAVHGTLLLDEVGDLPAQLRPKVLRALQARSAQKSGFRQEALPDVRIIASNSGNIGQESQSGEFRVDSWRRIDIHCISVPPLRKRQADIPELARHFLSEARAGRGEEFELTPTAELLLMMYPWPGNVGELERCIKAVAETSMDRRIDVNGLPEEIRSSALRSNANAENLSIEMVERRHIEAVLNAVGWNKVAAARTLGIDRATLYRKLLRFGLQGPTAAVPSRMGNAGQ